VTVDRDQLAAALLVRARRARGPGRGRAGGVRGGLQPSPAYRPAARPGPRRQRAHPRPAVKRGSRRPGGPAPCLTGCSAPTVAVTAPSRPGPLGRRLRYLAACVLLGSPGPDGMVVIDAGATLLALVAAPLAGGLSVPGAAATAGTAGPRGAAPVPGTAGSLSGFTPMTVSSTRPRPAARSAP
jgi:hypothetical protein